MKFGIPIVHVQPRHLLERELCSLLGWLGKHEKGKRHPYNRAYLQTTLGLLEYEDVNEAIDTCAIANHANGAQPNNGRR